VYLLNKKVNNITKIAEVPSLSEKPVWTVSWADPRFGQIFATGSFSHDLIIYKLEDDKKIKKLYQNKFLSSINSIEFGPWGTDLKLACVCSDGQIILVYLENDKYLVYSHQGHDHIATSISWGPYININLRSSNGDQIGKLMFATSACDNNIKIWEVCNKVREKSSSITTPVSPNVKKFDSVVSLDKKDKLKLLHTIEKAHDSYIRTVSWSKNIFEDSYLIASGSEDGCVRLWRLNCNFENTTKEHQSFTDIYMNKGFPVFKVSWNFTGRLLAVGSTNDKGDHVTIVFEETERNKWKEISTH